MAGLDRGVHARLIAQRLRFAIGLLSKVEGGPISLDEVEQREEQDPDHVNEVPIDR